MVPGIVTTILLVLFLIGWAWVWSPHRRSEFERASRAAIEDSAEGGEGARS